MVTPPGSPSTAGAEVQASPYLTFERGALPDSWFVDPAGFNADSDSFRREKWDRPLSDENLERAEAYVRECLTGTAALEQQGARIGGEALGAKLKTGGRKVVFVPLQRPSDSVIKHFAGAAKSAENFLNVVDAAAKRLRRMGWVVICKRHPLETDSPPLSYARYAPDDTHFQDLIELADSVALINSGVGLYAMMEGKPCYIFGEAFYTFDGLNQRVRTCSPEAFVDAVTQGHAVDRQAMLRFVHYLREEFYCFGKARVSYREHKDGSRRSITEDIDFYRIRLPNGARRNYDRAQPRPVSTAAPLLERYKLDIIQRRSPTGLLGTASAHRPTGHNYNDAVDAFLAGKYVKAAQMFDALAPKMPKPTGYRAAAEAYDRAGIRTKALERLRKAASMALKPGAVNRRIREMSRPRWLRKFLPEKPFPVEKV